MRTTNHFRAGHTVRRFLIILCLLISASVTLQSFSGNDAIKFNPDYKLKRISGTTVEVYMIDQKGEKQEYFFNDFNADVLLLVYRRIDMNLITDNLTKKYRLSETDCRRQVKMTLNTLEAWDIILRS